MNDCYDILFFTDPHLTHKNPSSRLDNYAETTLKKLNNITKIIKDNKVNAMIIGGDLFHSPIVSMDYLNSVVKIISNWDMPKICVSGNHDIYGYNIDTINRTAIGLLKNANVLYMENDYFEPILNDKNFVIEVHCNPYKDKLNKKDFYCSKDFKDDYSIQVIHNMILKDPIGIDIPHLLTKEIKTESDLVLCGHYHPGWKDHIIGNTTFINPGSLTRIERNESNKEFIPQVLLLSFVEINNKLEMNYDYITVEHEKSNIIFDFKSKTRNIEAEEVIKSFKTTLDELNTNSKNCNNLYDIVDMISNELELEDNYKIDLIHKLDIAKESNSKDDLQIAGYKSLDVNIDIKSVHLVNFQSHKDTIINFDYKLNSIIGESNSGKTAIIRAIKWCLYNNPKGNEFINTTAKDCSVKVIFNNGYYIKRSKGKTGSGEYEIGLNEEKLQTFKGFGSGVPIEITNIHQMPDINIKDSKENINISYQMDPPFLLSLSGADRAIIIGKLIGVDVLDNAISNLTLENKINAKQLKEYEIDYNLNTNELSRYKSLDGIEILFEEFEKEENILNQLLEYNNKIKELEKDILLNSDFIDYSDIENNLTNIELILKQTYDLIDIQTQRVNINNKIKLISNDNNIDLESIEWDIEKSETLIVYLKELLREKSNLFDIKKKNFNLKLDIKDIDRDLKEANDIYDNKLSELKNSWTELGICPTCGNSLSEENINKLIDN